MKSLYVAILFVMLGILSVSFVVFRSISNRTEKAYFDPVFDKVDQLEIESARAALDQDGPNAVSAYMQKLDRLFGGSHYLLDGHGLDIVSGGSREKLIPQPPATQSREQRQNQMVKTQQSSDERYWFVAVAPTDRSRPWLFLPYYLLIAGAITLLCWLAAAGLISPIRKVSKTAAAIEVRDHGTGVPKELLRKIFEPFFRVEEARNKVGGGSGLGLSIANRAIHLHYGHIVAENAFPGLKVKMSVPLFEAKKR